VKSIPRCASCNALDAPEHDIDSQCVGHESRTRGDTPKRLALAASPQLGPSIGFLLGRCGP
jgi:hypothetical protein